MGNDGQKAEKQAADRVTPLNDKYTKTTTWGACLAEQAGFLSGGTFTLPDGSTGGALDDLEEYWALDTWRETQQARALLEERLHYAAPRPEYGSHRGLGASAKVIAQNIRAIDNGAVGDLTDAEWEAALDAFERSCAYCGVGDVTLHIEHVVPISRGGATTKSNIVPACRSCNSHKHARTPGEWLDSDAHESFTKKHQALLSGASV